MVTQLVPMTRLKSLFLGFHSPQSCPDPEHRPPPPLTRAVLPALTHLSYRGVSEFLEDFVARIHTPLLHNADITFFNQLIFDIPRLPQFIRPLNKFKAFDQAHVLFQSRYVQVKLSSQAGTVDEAIFKLKISCKPSDWQLSSLAQVCNWSFTPYSTIERRIGSATARRHGEYAMDRTFTPVYRCEGSLPIRGTCATCRPRPAGVRRGIRCITRASKSFL